MIRRSLDSRWRDPEQPECGGQDRSRCRYQHGTKWSLWFSSRGPPGEEGPCRRSCGGPTSGGSPRRRWESPTPTLDAGFHRTTGGVRAVKWRGCMLLLQHDPVVRAAPADGTRGVCFSVIVRSITASAATSRRSIADVAERTREGRSPPPGCDGLLGPRGAVGGCRPSRQRDTPTRQAFERRSMRRFTHRAVRVTWICSSALAENSD